MEEALKVAATIAEMPVSVAMAIKDSRQPRVRDDADRRRALRAPLLPRRLRHAGAEGGHVGLPRQAQSQLRRHVSDARAAPAWQGSGGARHRRGGRRRLHLPAAAGARAPSRQALADTERHAHGAGDRAAGRRASGALGRAVRCPTGATPLPRACCWRAAPSAVSTFNTISGATTSPACCCSTSCAARRRAGCACGCCWTITTPPGSTRMLAALDAEPNIEVRLFNPVQHACLAQPGLPVRLQPPESAHAQQILHGRQPGDDRRRAQHRRRVFRRGGRCAVCRSGRAGGRAGGAGDLARFRSLLEQRLRLSGSEPGRRRREAEPAGALARRAAQLRSQPGAQRYIEAIRSSAFVAQLKAGQAPLEWNPVTAWSATIRPRRPARPGRKTAGSRSCGACGASPRTSSTWSRRISCRVKTGAQALADLARGGARVRVLTNSLEATDVAAVHAGYAKWRHDLLRCRRLPVRAAAQLGRRPAGQRGADASAAPHRACMRKPSASTAAVSSSAPSIWTGVRST